MHVVYFNSLCCLIYKVCASFENVDMIINIRTSHVFNRGILTMLVLFCWGSGGEYLIEDWKINSCQLTPLRCNIPDTV